MILFSVMCAADKKTHKNNLVINSKTWLFNSVVKQIPMNQKSKTKIEPHFIN